MMGPGFRGEGIGIGLDGKKAIIKCKCLENRGGRNLYHALQNSFTEKRIKQQISQIGVSGKSLRDITQENAIKIISSISRSPSYF